MSRVPPSPASAEVIAFAAGNHPVFSPWREALGERVALQTCWGLDAADLRRWLFGLLPREQPAARILPLALGRHPWRTWHARRACAGAPHATTVVLTRPDQAALLPELSGKRRMYYAIDDYETYGRDWSAAERNVLQTVDHVVAVSTGLAAKLSSQVGRRTRVTVCPNAIPASWLARSAHPATRQHARTALRQRLGLRPDAPLVGVLGRVSSRLRLDWLLAAVEAEPRLHWVFVGDLEPAEVVPDDRVRIARLQNHPRVHLTGRVPFAAMLDHAAALDLAVLPYSDRSTNPLGSAVRLFLHLPHPAPLLATDGCRQVRELAPQLTYFQSADELIAALRAHHDRAFVDPAYPARVQLAQQHTWEARAQQWTQWIRA